MKTSGEALLKVPQPTPEFRPPLKLTAYDVFGYVTPGAVVFALIALFEVWVLSFENGTVGDGLPPHLPVSSGVATVFRLTNAAAGMWVVYLLLALLILMGVYITGHVVASLSSFTIDRIFIYKGYGYPYRILLETDESDRWDRTSRSFYWGLFLWLNVYLVSRYVVLLLGDGQGHWVKRLLYYLATFFTDISWGMPCWRSSQ